MGTARVFPSFFSRKIGKHAGFHETAVVVNRNVISTVLRFPCNIETLLPFAF